MNTQLKPWKKTTVGATPNTYLSFWLKTVLTYNHTTNYQLLTWRLGATMGDRERSAVRSTYPNPQFKMAARTYFFVWVMYVPIFKEHYIRESRYCTSSLEFSLIFYLTCSGQKAWDGTLDLLSKSQQLLPQTRWDHVHTRDHWPFVEDRKTMCNKTPTSCNKKHRCEMTNRMAPLSILYLALIRKALWNDDWTNQDVFLSVFAFQCWRLSFVPQFARHDSSKLVQGTKQYKW